MMKTPWLSRRAVFAALSVPAAKIAEDRIGVPLRVDLRVIDGATCKPSERARIDIWHADAQGIYSGFEGQGDKQDLSP